MSDDAEPRTILQIHGTQRSTCGYCSPSGERSAGGSSVSIGASPLTLSCNVYQKMVDRGWRRSGTYAYKPTMKETCCPQYPIRLDALSFEPTRNQRKALYRFNRQIIDGEGGGGEEKSELVEVLDAASSTSPKQRKGKASKPETRTKPRKQVFSLVDAVHEPEHDYRLANAPQTKHKFEIHLEPACFTEEKFELYKDYQFHVHKETEKQPQSFKRCPLIPAKRNPIPYEKPSGEGLPTHYGTHHQLYRIDGKLVAMSVLDILPGCVSGVYFMYAHAWERCQFGKLSVLREAALVREMHLAGLPDLKWVYLGFYIHSCQKMRYKGEYSPSYLLDPESYEWYPMTQCTPMLDKYRYACFSEPTHSINAAEPPVVRDMRQDELDEVFLVQRQRDGLAAFPVSQLILRAWTSYKEEILESIDALGLALAKDVFLCYKAK